LLGGRRRSFIHLSGTNQDEVTPDHPVDRALAVTVLSYLRNIDELQIGVMDDSNTSNSPPILEPPPQSTMPIATQPTSASMSRYGSPTSSNPETPLSPSTLALLSLTQDITALISLSIEATTSLVHDLFKSALGIVGGGEVVRYQPRGEKKLGGEAGRGLAVVVVGANEGMSIFLVRY
jgi:hypothetical protein